MIFLFELHCCVLLPFLIDSVPWVRCASGNIYPLSSNHGNFVKSLKDFFSSAFFENSTTEHFFWCIVNNNLNATDIFHDVNKLRIDPFRLFAWDETDKSLKEGAARSMIEKKSMIFFFELHSSALCSTPFSW